MSVGHMVGAFFVSVRREDSKQNERRLNVGKAARDGCGSEWRGADAGTHMMWVT